MEIIPSILSSDPDEAHAMVTLCEGVVERVHIDIIDSRFADNKTVTPESFADEMYRVNVDFHLMVEEPIAWIGRCVRANADRIIGQIELMEDQREFCEQIKERNMQSGLALDLTTKIDAIEDSAFELVDVIVVMSVNAGFGGQKFDSSALEKITDLSLLREEKNFHFRICDDGGVTLENEKLLQRAAVDEVCVGRRLFQGNLSDNIETWNRTISRYNKS